jgi:hypothetical protein
MDIMPATASSLKCPRCKFVGKSVQSLKVHIGRVHGAKKKAAGRRGRKANACSTCGQGFKTPAALKAHNTRFHSGRAVKAGGMKGGRVSAIDRDMRQLPLSAVADLFEACQKELQRRLMPSME